MSRHPQPAGTRGSLRWIQTAVNHRPELLDVPILERASGATIEWLSPRVEDDFAEYRDETALDLLGVSTPNRQLSEFWPALGPQWDALGRLDTGTVILLEAKAHVDELFSAGTQAGATSRLRIQAAFEDVRGYLGAKSGLEWTGSLYQFCNRIAHLYYLTVLNEVPALLVNCYFIGDEDMGGGRQRRRNGEQLSGW